MNVGGGTRWVAKSLPPLHPPPHTAKGAGAQHAGDPPPPTRLALWQGVLGAREVLQRQLQAVTVQELERRQHLPQSMLGAHQHLREGAGEGGRQAQWERGRRGRSARPLLARPAPPSWNAPPPLSTPPHPPTCCATSKLGTARYVTLTAAGRGGHSRETAVMTPSVPSAPMNSCLRSYLGGGGEGGASACGRRGARTVGPGKAARVCRYWPRLPARPPSHPVLSLRSVPSRSSTSPLACTTSRPSTDPCSEP